MMFGLDKIQEMIPGNKYLLLKSSFSSENSASNMGYMAQNRKKWNW